LKKHEGLHGYIQNTTESSLAYEEAIRSLRSPFKKKDCLKRTSLYRVYPNNNSYIRI